MEYAPSQNQLCRIWTQIESGTQYPGWAAEFDAINTLTRFDPLTLWTRPTQDSAWAIVTMPEAAN
jgi:hypothetical protein